MEIDEDRLIQVLADLHVIEASLTAVTSSYRDSIKQVALEKCAALHKISVDQLEQELVYIDRKPEYQRMLYKRVLDTLESYMARADSLSIVKDTAVIAKPPKKPVNRKH